VVGNQQIDQYEKDGETRLSIDIVANTVQSLTTKADREQAAAAPAATRQDPFA